MPHGHKPTRSGNRGTAVSAVAKRVGVSSRALPKGTVKRGKGMTAGVRSVARKR